MLDGAPNEDPFSILSASIEHPLEVKGRRVERSHIVESLEDAAEPLQVGGFKKNRHTLLYVDFFINVKLLSS